MGKGAKCPKCGGVPDKVLCVTIDEGWRVVEMARIPMCTKCGQLVTP